MEELEKYINKCYLELDKDCIFVYKLIKFNNKYGFLFHEIETKPIEIFIYEDFPNEEEIKFMKSFIPELDFECSAKEISEGHYYDLVSRIEKLKLAQDVVNQQIKDFVKEYGLEQKV